MNYPHTPSSQPDEPNRDAFGTGASCARVIAVSTAAPQWVDINGVPTHTSIVRDPHPGPLHFGADGPEGNALALHTETVYAFPLEHYDYWAAQLGIDRTRWSLCQWGENLTVAGLSEDELRIGDRLHFSEGVVLEVSGARTPCGKLSWRLGVPSTALKTMTSKGWLGMYLRVIGPGMISAGETITVTSPHPGNLTVGELGRLLDRGMAADPADLERAAEMPAISQQNHEQLLNTADHMRDMARATANRWRGWRPFAVTKRQARCSDVVTIGLEPLDGGPIAPYRAGQFLPVRVPCGTGDVVRTWSLSHYAEEPRGYELTVKRIEAGIGSNWLHALAEGDVVEVRAPAGRFVIERSGIRPVVMISAGIGVTPVLAMMQAHALCRRPTPLEWIHVARSGAQHICRSDADAVLTANINFTRHVFYSRPDAGDVPGADYDAAGRLTKEYLQRILDQPVRYWLAGREIEINGRTREFYICGPAAFEADVKRWLIELGVQSYLIRSELFTAARGEAIGGEISEANVHFVRSESRAKWDDEEPVTLLELSEKAGLAP